MSRTKRSTLYRNRMSDAWRNRVGVGRWWKRALAKARRRHIKQVVRGERGKEPTGYESWVNWKDT